MRRRSPVVIAGLILLLALAGQSWLTSPQATAQPNTGALTVAIKPLTPFVFKQGEGYDGFSIDLWKEIAARNHWQFQYRWVETVSDQLAAVESGEADVAITGISVTSEREERLDFSVSMFNAGLQIMTPAKAESTLLGVVKTVFSPLLLRLFAAIAVIILAVGHLVWLVQRRRNRKWPRGYFRGVGEGIWLAGMTLATVGHGDETPGMWWGKLVALVWMFGAVFLIAYFTAIATSALTVQQIEGTIKGPNELPGKRIMTVGGSTAAQWLTNNGIGFRTVKSIEDAYPTLLAGDVDAIVYDGPVLQYYAATKSEGKLSMAGAPFKREDYGIAVRTGSPLRKDINRALLDIKSDGAYQRMYKRWFGALDSE